MILCDLNEYKRLCLAYMDVYAPPEEECQDEGDGGNDESAFYSGLLRFEGRDALSAMQITMWVV